MNYVFIKTSKGRHGLHASMYDLNYNEVVDLLKKNSYSEQVRIAPKGGSYFRIECVSLEEFEKLKFNEVLTPEDIQCHFSQIIRKKYGTSKISAEKKRIPRKELEPGRLYELENGDKEYYLGYVKAVGEVIYLDYWTDDRKDPICFEGYVGVSEYNKTVDKVFSFSHNSYRNFTHPTTTKNIRKYVDAFDVRMEIPKTFEGKDDKGGKLLVEFFNKKGGK